MDWNSTSRPFLSRLPESSFSFLYNYNFDQYPGAAMAAEAQQGLVLEMEKSSYGNLEKKKRLTSEQLDSLERSFQEEIKLDPDRKTRLSRELGLQPRQIAIWFQNRRARWKAKQLEHLYDTLKHEFDTINREKQKLQEEVMKLKIMLREQSGSRKQVSTVYTDASGDETVESTSVAIRCPSNPRGSNANRQVTECNYLYNMEDYNPVSPPFWGALPSYPQ